MNDKICSLIDGEYIEYVEPSGIYHFEHDGDMISIQSQQLCSTTTLNHKLYIQKRNKQYYELADAKDVYKQRIKFKKDGIKLGSDIKTIKLGESEFNMDAYLQLLAMWISDGHLDKTSKSRIVLTFIKPRKINLMKEVCKKLDLDIKSNLSKNNASNSNYNNLSGHHYIRDIDIFESFKELNVGAINKYLPEFVWNLNQRQSRLLLETLIQFDGTIGKTYSCYYTSSKKLANDITKLALHAGWSAHIKINRTKGSSYKIDGISEGYLNADALVVRIIKSKNRPQINHGHCNDQDGQTIEIKQYKGIVSCVEVSSHVFYMRENGIPHWTGNSSRSG